MSEDMVYNGKKIGEFYQEVDGFYVFVPEPGPGYWNEHIIMRTLYELRKLNIVWDLQIMTDPKISNWAEDDFNE